MDIRKFLSPKGKGKPSKARSIDDDDFQLKSHSKLKKQKKGVLFDSDSSDEDPIPKKTKKKIKSSDVITISDEEELPGKKQKKIAKNTTSSNRVKKQEPKSRPKPEITPADFFSKCKPKVVRETRLKKRKASEESKTEQRKYSFDDDIDFDGSLNMTPKKVKRELEETKTESTKILASKVAAKLNGNSEKVKKEKEPFSSSKDHNVARKKPDIDSVSVKREKIPVIDSNKNVKKNTPEKKVRQPSSAESGKVKKEVTPTKTSEDVGGEGRHANNKNNTTTPISDKKERFLKYQHWQNRGGAKAPGSKEIPEGEENCLEGLTFVITGILESLERDDAKSLIERYGGKVTGSVSSRTSYVICGDEPGESKIKKAEQHKTKQIDEDALLNLIRTKKGKKSKWEIAAEREVKHSITPIKKLSKLPKETIPVKQKTINQKSPTDKIQTSSGDSAKFVEKADKPKQEESLMWVDKYKPISSKQIIGQQSAKSNVSKLQTWLTDWQKNNRPAMGSKPKPKPKPTPWGGGDQTGAGFKAALLSGPPGVGKTTAATLVCQELGFTYIEMNASDTRSKRTLKEEISQMTDNTSISNMFGSKELQKDAASGRKSALVMDEVDGMAGNEDRGGMQELIQIIKTTKIPIICMCNDRNAMKIRSLANHCFDLRFQRPRVEQILGSMMSICYKEQLKIPAPAMQALIRGCNQDIRQVLHNLSMLRANSQSVSYDDAKEHANKSQKDVDIGIFDIARKLLSESSSTSINEKLNLFFMDYSLMPLFVQENYPCIRTASARGDIKKQLDCLSKAADSIALSSCLDKLVRKDQAWSALPTYGLMSTVLPCTFMAGGMTSMITFPKFLGKMSTTNKNRRLVQELKFHSSLATGGADAETFTLDYIPYLRWHLTQPLIVQSQTGGDEIRKATAMLDTYDMLKEDFDSVIELGQFSGKPQPMSKVDTKVKSAFTRTFNRECHKTPYSVMSTAASKKSRKATGSDDIGGFEESEEGGTQELSDHEDDNDLGGMVKAKAAGKKAKASTSSKSGTKKAVVSRKKK